MNKLNYNIINLALSRYKSLNDNDREIVNSLIVIDILAACVHVAAERYLAGHTIGITLSLLSLGVIVSVTFATLDKINILTPIERRIKEIVNEINDPHLKMRV